MQRIEGQIAFFLDRGVAAMEGDQRMTELVQADRDQKAGEHEREHQEARMVRAVQHPYCASKERDYQQQERRAERRSRSRRRLVIHPRLLGLRTFRMSAALPLRDAA